ncbi:CppA N-terminal domain-containing protein [Streptococcus dentiloxodontae]
MTQESFTFQTPILRVNNRQDNINFYQNTLGFKLLTEENALAVFTAWENRKALFVIEESPSMNCRAVNGPKKLNKIVIRLNDPVEIENLLARDEHQAKAIYQGEKGYAFETLSPENDLFLVHAEDDVTTLKPVEFADVEVSDDFKGVSDFTIQAIHLNVPNVEAAQTFYATIFENSFPLEMTFVQAQGKDLTVSPDTTWDLEIMEVKVDADFDLANLQARLEEKQVSSYLDSKGSVLVLNDLSNIEIWLTK